MPCRPFLALLLFAVGCTSGDGDGNDAASGTTDSMVCEPGKTEACACPDGAQGAQTCEPDGQSWGMCDCGTGSTTGATSTTGTSTTSTSSSSGTSTSDGTGGSSGSTGTESTSGTSTGTAGSTGGGTRACSVLLQDCVAAEACYVRLDTGAEVCAEPVADPGGQGDDCTYLNSCEKGLGCVFPNDPENPTGLVCTTLCASNGGAPTCPAGTHCEQINMFYNNAPDVDDSVGMCVPDGWP